MGPKGNGDVQALNGTKGKWRYASRRDREIEIRHLPVISIGQREMEICKQQSKKGNGDMQAAKRGKGNGDMQAAKRD